MKRILIILQANYPWDVRVDKFVRSFLGAGVDVTVLSNNKDNLDPEDSHLGAQVYRTERYYAPVPFSPAWIRRIDWVVRKTKPDAIIVRDLPLFQVAYANARQHGIPLWLDMAEDYPATFLDMDRSLFERLSTRNYWLARLYERFAVHRADVITVVCPESKERLITFGIPDEKVFVVDNTPDDYFLSRFDSSIIHKPDKLIYTGHLGKKRGLETVLHAMSLIRRQGINFNLTIAGGDPSSISMLKRRSVDLGVDDLVEFLGMVPYTDLANLIAGSAWGLVPHLDTLHIRSTMPNKIHDYMAVGTPVIVSDVSPLRRLVEETRSGLVYRAGDANSLCDRLAEVSEKPYLREQLSKNAKRAYETVYSWKHSETRLFMALEWLRSE